MKTIAFWSRRLLEWLFPLECLGCGVIGSFCCPSCLSGVRTGGLLPLVVRDRTPLFQVWAGYPYGQPAVRRLLQDWKFGDPRSGGGYRAAGEVAAGLMRRAALSYAAVLEDAAGVIVPVPIHPTRLRSRGFNQAETLARAVGEILRKPVAAAALARRRAAAPRTLSGADRQEVPDGVFVVARTSAIVGRRVLLIDDVWTTGATLRACARALVAAGAHSVTGFVLASAHREKSDLERKRKIVGSVTLPNRIIARIKKILNTL